MIIYPLIIAFLSCVSATLICEFWNFASDCLTKCDDMNLSCLTCSNNVTCIDCIYGYGGNCTAQQVCTSNGLLYCQDCIRVTPYDNCVTCSFGYSLLPELAANQRCSENTNINCAMYLNGYCGQLDTTKTCGAGLQCLACNTTNVNICVMCNGFFMPTVFNNVSYCTPLIPANNGLSSSKGYSSFSDQDAKFGLGSTLAIVNGKLINKDSSLNPYITENNVVQYAYDAVGTNPAAKSFEKITVVATFYLQVSVVNLGTYSQYKQANRLENMAHVLAILSHGGGIPEGIRFYDDQVTKVVNVTTIDTLTQLISKAVILAQYQDPTIPDQTQDFHVNVRSDITLLRILGACEVLLRIIQGTKIDNSTQNGQNGKTVFNADAISLNQNMQTMLQQFVLRRIKDPNPGTKLQQAAEGKTSATQNFWLNEQKDVQIIIQAIGDIYKQDYSLQQGDIEVFIANTELIKLQTIGTVRQSFSYVALIIYTYNPMEQASVNYGDIPKLYSNIVQVLFYRGNHNQNVTLAPDGIARIQYQLPIKPQYVFSNFVWRPSYWDPTISQFSSYRTVTNQLAQFNFTLYNEAQKNSLVSWQINSFAMQGVIGGSCLSGFYVNATWQDSTNCSEVCDASCMKCFGPLSTQCTLCSLGQQPHNNSIGEMKCLCTNVIGQLLDINGECTAKSTNPVVVDRSVKISDLEPIAYMAVGDDLDIGQVASQLLLIAQKTNLPQNDIVKMKQNSSQYQTFANIAVVLSAADKLGLTNTTNVNTLLSAILDYNILESPYCDIDTCVVSLWFALDNILFKGVHGTFSQKSKVYFPDITAINNARLKALNGLEQLAAQVVLKLCQVNILSPGLFTYQFKSSFSNTSILVVDFVERTDAMLDLSGKDGASNKTYIYYNQQALSILNASSKGQTQVQSFIWLTKFASNIFDIPIIIKQSLSANGAVVFSHSYNVYHDSMTAQNAISDFAQSPNRTVVLTIPGNTTGMCMMYAPNPNPTSFGQLQMQLNLIETLSQPYQNQKYALNFQYVQCSLHDWSYGYYINIDLFDCPAGYYAMQSGIDSCIVCSQNVLECKSSDSFYSCKGTYSPYLDGSTEAIPNKCNCINNYQLAYDNVNNVYKCRDIGNIPLEYNSITLVGRSISNATLIDFERAILLSTSLQQISEVALNFTQFAANIAGDPSLFLHAAKVLSALGVNRYFSMIEHFNATYMVCNMIMISNTVINNSVITKQMLEIAGVSLQYMSVNNKSNWDPKGNLGVESNLQNYIQSYMDVFNWLLQQFTLSESALIQSDDLPMKYHFSAFKYSFWRTNSSINITANRTFLQLYTDKGGLNQQYSFNLQSTAFNFQPIGEFPYYVSRAILEANPFRQFVSQQNDTVLERTWIITAYNSSFADVSNRFTGLVNNSISVRAPTQYNIDQDILQCEYWNKADQKYELASQVTFIPYPDLLQTPDFFVSFPKLQSGAVFRVIKSGTKLIDSNGTNTQVQIDCSNGQYVLTDTQSCAQCSLQCSSCVSATNCTGQCGLFGPVDSITDSCACQNTEIKMYNGGCLDKQFAINQWKLIQADVNLATTLQILLNYTSYAGQQNGDAVKQVLNQANNIIQASPILTSSQALAAAQLVHILIETGVPDNMAGNWDVLNVLVDSVSHSGKLDASYFPAFLGSISKGITLVGKQDVTKQEVLTASLKSAFALYADALNGAPTQICLSDGSFLVLKQYTNTPAAGTTIPVTFSAQYPTYQVLFNKDLFDASSQATQGDKFMQSYYIRQDSPHKISTQVTHGFFISIQTYLVNVDNKHIIIPSVSLYQGTTFSIQFDQIDAAQTCAYWDGAKWNTDGLTKYGNDCKSTHLTDFAIIDMAGATYASLHSQQMFISITLMLSMLTTFLFLSESV